MTTVIAPVSLKKAAFREKALRSLDRLPPLSPSVGRLLSKLAFVHVNLAELAGIVEKDTLLCAHILRAVNSAGFGRAHTVTSPKQAMSLLGINTLRRITLGFTVSNLFSRVRPAPSWSRVRFNLHSGATAILSEAIASRLPVDHGDGVFVAGMLHDIGTLLIAVGLPKQYEAITALAVASGRPVVDCERETIGTDHAELSGIALTKWALPELVCRAVFNHHSPDAPGASWLALVIHRADRFVNHLGISINALQDESPADAPSLHIPGFNYDERATLHQFETEWKELSRFFA